jgi:hypothetical protein
MLREGIINPSVILLIPKVPENQEAGLAAQKNAGG